MSVEWLNLCPNIPVEGQIFTILRECANSLSSLGSDFDAPWRQVKEVRDRFFKEAEGCADSELTVRVGVSVLCDLRQQGWTFMTAESGLFAAHPRSDESQPSAKDRIRASLLVERDAQLRTGSVRSFIASMEQRRYHRNGWVSIFSLMRDGSELATQLREIRSKEETERIRGLRAVIDPYIQCVDDSTCEHTGLPLKEIWRYFRHTWVTTYQSVPGRNIWFLVRDRAAKYHPIIGIAALGSAIVQLTVRDQWIGWNRDAFLRWAMTNTTDELAQWVDLSVRNLIADVYVSDLVEQNYLAPERIEKPDEATIVRLRKLAKEATEAHRLYPKPAEHKSSAQETEDWERLAKTYLFVSKRAQTMASLLEARLRLQSVGFTVPDADALERALRTSAGRNAIAEIVRQVKGMHVGNDMMDIIICGAVQPYNPILGGKLVALMMTSPEVAEAYRERYHNKPSIIASSMAGRPINRNPQLVLLGTTSLYGTGSSQYNRLRLPANEMGSTESKEIRYCELGHTEGFGSYHFSAVTMEEMEKLVARHSSGRRVNSIFGEGVNPKLRKVRDALQLAGFRAESLLNHGDKRIIYGIPLATNFREVLLGMAAEPKNIFPDEPLGRSTKRIADYWTKRWLAKRIESDQVLAQVEQHHLLYPIRHGARVAVSKDKDDMQLFGE